MIPPVPMLHRSISDLCVFALVAVVVISSTISTTTSASSSPQPRLRNFEGCPPNGWDSYDSQPIWAGLIPTESSALQQAEILYDFAKLNGGNFETLILDEGWADFRELNSSYVWYLTENGVPTPIPANFPSSQNGTLGLQPLAQILRDKYQMKLGVWHIKGVPRAAVEQKLPIAGTTNCTCDMIVTAEKLSCSWHKDVYDVDASTYCGQRYYDSVIDQWVRWGISYFKIDCIFGSDLRMTEIQAYSVAVERARVKYGVDLTLSISPGFLATLETFSPLSGTGVNLARITDDLWDSWGPSLLPAPEALLSNVCATVWSLVYFQPFLDSLNTFGHFLRPDPDMIPVGRLQLLYPRASQLTGKMLNFVFGMWTITRSPLVLSGNLTNLANDTLEVPELQKLLSNPDLHEMHCTGRKPSVVYAENVTEFGLSDIRNQSVLFKGEVVWKLMKGENSGFQIYIAYFPFDPFVDHDIDVNATSRFISWGELGLETSKLFNNKKKHSSSFSVFGKLKNETIPSVTAYDVLNRRVLHTFNPQAVGGFTMTVHVNNAAVWLMDLHE